MASIWRCHARRAPGRFSRQPWQMRSCINQLAPRALATTPLHIETPLLFSQPLSQHLGAEVYLKLDCLQPPGSFKLRGIGATVQELAARGAKKIVSSSGGNAGLATAYAAKRIGMPVTVVVPESTETSTIEQLEDYGAQVVVHGNAWDEANQCAMEIAESDNGSLVHPFMGATTWRGHATLVEELKKQLPKAPDAIVTVVGGGGLLMGILQGLQLVGWDHSTRVVACETEGAASMARSIESGELVTLPAITSIAKSLGAKTVGDEIFKRCQETASSGSLKTYVMSDTEAVKACARFAKDHRLLVEPACGAGLAAVYGRSPELEGARTVVVEVCGGARVDVDMLQGWMQDLGIGPSCL